MFQLDLFKFKVVLKEKAFFVLFCFIRGFGTTLYIKSYVFNFNEFKYLTVQTGFLSHPIPCGQLHSFLFIPCIWFSMYCGLISAALPICISVINHKRIVYHAFELVEFMLSLNQKRETPYCHNNLETKWFDM